MHQQYVKVVRAWQSFYRLGEWIFAFLKNRPSVLAESKPISLFCSFDMEVDRIPDRILSR